MLNDVPVSYASFCPLTPTEEEQDIFQRWEERVIRNELMLNPITKTIGECEVEELLDQEELKEKLENEMNHLKINSK